VASLCSRGLGTRVLTLRAAPTPHPTLSRQHSAKLNDSRQPLTRQQHNSRCHSGCAASACRLWPDLGPVHALAAPSPASRLAAHMRPQSTLWLLAYAAAGGPPACTRRHVGRLHTSGELPARCRPRAVLPIWYQCVRVQRAPLPLDKLEALGNLSSPLAGVLPVTVTAYLVCAGEAAAAAGSLSVPSCLPAITITQTRLPGRRRCRCVHHAAGAARLRTGAGRGYPRGRRQHAS
jgi:hypothetical protein